MEEPIDASDEVVPSSEKDGRRDDSSKSSSSLPSNSSGTASKRKHDEDLDQDAPTLKRRCALHGPSHFPPTQEPVLESSDTAASEEVTDLIQRLSKM